MSTKTQETRLAGCLWFYLRVVCALAAVGLFFVGVSGTGGLLTWGALLLCLLIVFGKRN